MTVAKKISTGFVVGALTLGLAGGIYTPAVAEECKGETKTEVVSVDFITGGQTNEVKLDSCKVQNMIDGYGQVKDAAGLAGLLGSGYWPVGVSGGIFFGWAWNNQEKLKECAQDGNGVTFTEINGIITGCSSQ